MAKRLTGDPPEVSSLDVARVLASLEGARHVRFGWWERKLEGEMEHVLGGSTGCWVGGGGEQGDLLVDLGQGSSWRKSAVVSSRKVMMSNLRYE